MLLFISIFELRFLQEEYARRVSMKYFKNIPERVWSVCEANSLRGRPHIFVENKVTTRVVSFFDWGASPRKFLRKHCIFIISLLIFYHLQILRGAQHNNIMLFVCVSFEPCNQLLLRLFTQRSPASGVMFFQAK